MNAPSGTFTRQFARVCVNCPVCRQARRKQRGLTFSFVNRVERGMCPFCRAYERVYGRKSHEQPSARQGEFGL